MNESMVLEKASKETGSSLSFSFFFHLGAQLSSPLYNVEIAVFFQEDIHPFPKTQSISALMLD